MANRLLILAGLGALISSGIATAIQGPEPLAKEAKICRASETRTGSRIRTGRRCRTAAEWAREDAERRRIPPSLLVTEGQNDGHAKPRSQ